MQKSFHPRDKLTYTLIGAHLKTSHRNKNIYEKKHIQRKLIKHNICIFIYEFFIKFIEMNQTHRKPLCGYV